MPSVELVGDWAKIRHLLGGGLSQKIHAAVRRATLKSALLLVREIKKGIRSQAPGGHAFAPLSPITIDRKGSSKALIDTGFLINSITQVVLKDKAFIGLLKTAVGPDGASRENIGAVMEYGATITQPNGHTIIIPPRPFMHPTFAACKPQIVKYYHDALKACLNA